MALHFACSEKPVMLSGLHILIRGNSEASAILTAKAVLPEPTGPKMIKPNSEWYWHSESMCCSHCISGDDFSRRSIFKVHT